MTSRSLTKPKALSAAIPHDRISYLSGDWVPHREMRVAVDDAGFRQGVTVVERLRTYGGRIFQLESHLERWQHSLAHLGIAGTPGRVETQTLLEELLNRNAALLKAVIDTGITMFATPGEPGMKRPTFGLHLNPLDQDRIARHRRQGQPVVLTDVRQPDPQCWPRTIKVRSRIHYFLADRIARRQENDAVGVLLDLDGSITETSVANLAIVRDSRICSPPGDRVLGGITQAAVETLAAEAGIEWSKEPVSADELCQADEVLMMGTDGGLWFAHSISGIPVGNATSGEIYQLLLLKFDSLVHRTA